MQPEAQLQSAGGVLAECSVQDAGGPMLPPQLQPPAAGSAAAPGVPQPPRMIMVDNYEGAVKDTCERGDRTLVSLKAMRPLSSAIKVRQLLPVVCDAIEMHEKGNSMVAIMPGQAHAVSVGQPERADLATALAGESAPAFLHRQPRILAEQIAFAAGQPSLLANTPLSVTERQRVLDAQARRAFMVAKLYAAIVGLLLLPAEAQAHSRVLAWQPEGSVSAARAYRLPLISQWFR